jgi:ABC-type transporter Mla MlaB component
MNFDFELKWSKGFLKIEGPLSDPDSIELNRVLSQSLERCHSLELNIDNITSISSSCMKSLAQGINLAKQKRKPLTVATRYQREAMHRWIKNISAM